MRVPFGEGDEAMLRFALEGHDDAPRFRSQRTCFLFYHQDRGTQLGAPVTDRGTAWNPFWRPDVACEPQRSIRPHDLTRPYPNMGVTEFQRRLTTMLRKEGAGISAWSDWEPDFVKRSTLLTFFVAAPFGCDTEWQVEGRGESRATFAQTHPSCSLEVLEVAPAKVDASTQTESSFGVPIGLAILDAARVRVERMELGLPADLKIELDCEQRAWERALAQKPKPKRKSPRHVRGRGRGVAARSVVRRRVTVDTAVQTVGTGTSCPTIAQLRNAEEALGLDPDSYTPLATMQRTLPRIRVRPGQSLPSNDPVESDHDDRGRPVTLSRSEPPLLGPTAEQVNAPSRGVHSWDIRPFPL